MDPTPIIVAAMGLSGVLGAAWINARANRNTQRQVAEVKAEVTTNHGKPAREYLEMIEPLRDGMDALFGLLADHTAQDAEQFDELRKEIRKAA